jgi:hypothetical protein
LMGGKILQDSFPSIVLFSFALEFPIFQQFFWHRSKLKWRNWNKRIFVKGYLECVLVSYVLVVANLRIFLQNLNIYKHLKDNSLLIIMASKVKQQNNVQLFLIDKNQCKQY